MPGSMESSSKRRKLESHSRKEAAKSADLTLTLDPMEVMKAMMAAQSGKAGQGKEDSSDEDERSQEEDDDDEEDEDVVDSEGAGSEAGTDNSGSDSGGEGGNTGSTAADDDDDDDDDRDDVEEPTAVKVYNEGPSRSRIALAARSALGPSTSRPTPSDPFASNPKPSKATTFEALGLSTPLINALSTINITKPTEIQAACVEAIMAGRDCIGGAKTGSGKTLAFALPIVERIARDPFGVWAVVLTPTRCAQLVLPVLWRRTRAS